MSDVQFGGRNFNSTCMSSTSSTWCAEELSSTRHTVAGVLHFGIERLDLVSCSELRAKCRRIQRRNQHAASSACCAHGFPSRLFFFHVHTLPLSWPFSVPVRAKYLEHRAYTNAQDQNTSTHRDMDTCRGLLSKKCRRGLRVHTKVNFSNRKIARPSGCKTEGARTETNIQAWKVCSLTRDDTDRNR